MQPIKRVKITKNIYAQIIIGPPGSGKTTYCAKSFKLYKETLNRNCAVINLDPANDNMEYTPKIDIMELIKLEDVMNDLNLGPNGALMYCMEYLEENFDWLLDKLNCLDENYLIFDLPGQVELFTHHNSIKNMFNKLQNIGFHFCVVHLVDSHYCSDASKFISTLLLSLSTMLQIALPHVNVLSKADQLKEHSTKLDFGIDFYTDVLNLDYLLDVLNDGQFTSKYKKLNEALISLIEDYSLVSFLPLDVNNNKSMITLKNAIDKANGYVYGAGEERTIQSLLSCAVGARTETEKYDSDMM